jgi:hypothetical protein
MFVTPNFTVNVSPDEYLVSLSQNEEGKIDEYYISDERGQLISLGLPKKQDRLILTPIGNDKALYLNKDGSMKIDFIQG